MKKLEGAASFVRVCSLCMPVLSYVFPVASPALAQTQSSPLLVSPMWAATRAWGYAASRISSNLKGRSKQFGWLQALTFGERHLGTICHLRV